MKFWWNYNETKVCKHLLVVKIIVIVYDVRQKKQVESLLNSFVIMCD